MYYLHPTEFQIKIHTKERLRTLMTMAESARKGY